MVKLLKEGFAKAKVSKRFWICAAILVGLSLLYVLLLNWEGTNPMDPDDKQGADMALFGLLGDQSLFMAIVPAMLLVRDFTQNTVRNKIICGCSRTSIYIAHTIVFSLIALFYHVVSMLSALAFGIPILGVGELANGYVAAYLGYSVLLIFAYAAMTIFVCMLIRGISGVIIAYVINSLLSTFAVIAILVVKNDDIIKLMNCAILDMQAQVILSGMAEGELPGKFEMVLMPLCSLSYIIGLPLIGIRIFKKADLK